MTLKLVEKAEMVKVLESGNNYDTIVDGQRCAAGNSTFVFIDLGWTVSEYGDESGVRRFTSVQRLTEENKATYLRQWKKIREAQEQAKKEGEKDPFYWLGSNAKSSHWQNAFLWTKGEAENRLEEAKVAFGYPSNHIENRLANLENQVNRILNILGEKRGEE